jgi:branched-chain amino acid transport system substrate-binding protein
MKKGVVWFLLVTLVIFVVAYNNFKSKEEITIGFVAGLSGKYSLLGQSVLNGFLLKFDEINYSIDDKAIHILQMDDAQNEHKAKAAIQSFIAKDIDLIVGNTTSSMTRTSLDILKAHPNKTLFSITASSNEFSNIKDNFLRVQVAHSKARFHRLSNYLVQNDLQHVVVIYDSNNQSYSNNYLLDFQDSFLQQGGIPFVKIFDINQQYETILNELKQLHVDLIAISANSIDSAKLIQYLRLNGILTQLFIAGWAKSEEFILNVGKAGEQILVSTGYDENSKSQAYLDFVEKYKAKYQEAPTAFSAQAYEAADIIIQMLKDKHSLQQFQSWVLSKKVFQGLQGEIIFDEYGDVERENFLMQLHDGQFIRMDY